MIAAARAQRLRRAASGLWLPRRKSALRGSARGGRHRVRRARRRPRSNCSATSCARATSRAKCGVAVRSEPPPRSTSTPRAPFSHPAAGGAMIIKAVAGGGGRGMRVVTRRDRGRRRLQALLPPRRRPRSATRGSMSSDCSTDARHIEVQIIGDGTARSAICGSANARCSGVTRSSIEVAPSPSLTPALRARAHRRRAAHRRRGALPQPRHLRVPGRRRRPARAAHRVHRGQSAAAGRAHRHRGGHRRRSRARRSSHRRRRNACRTRL